MSKAVYVFLTSILLVLPVDAAQVKEITFSSQGQTIVGHMIYPDSYEPGQKLPAVIVIGSWTTVKEQMADVYARKLSRFGFIALTFDFRHWGESEGVPRYLESPREKTKDIVAAAQFLFQHSDVISDQIGGLAICTSSGYMAHAASQSNLLKSIALIGPWLHDLEIAAKVYGGSDRAAVLKEMAREAKEKYSKTGDQTLIKAASVSDKQALMYRIPYYASSKRGLIKEWENKFDITSLEEWFEFDAIAVAKHIDIPVLIVHSSRAAIPGGARRFHKLLESEKEILWLDNISHEEFYDRPKAVNPSIDAAVKHFQFSFNSLEY